MKTIVNVLQCIVVAVVVAIAAYAIFDGIWSTGPNCPGMDPQWLGFCEEVK